MFVLVLGGKQQGWENPPELELAEYISGTKMNLLADWFCVPLGSDPRL